MKLGDIVGDSSRTWMETMHWRNFESMHGAKRSRIGRKILWDEEKPIGGTETLVLGELISPKNSKIPQRNQWIANGGLGVALTVVLMCVWEREVRKIVKG
jgi:hypothetical protein